MWWHWQLTRDNWVLLTFGLYNFPHWYFSSWILVLLIVLVSTTLPLILIFLFLPFCNHGSVLQFNSSLGRLGQSHAANPCHPGWACCSGGGWAPQGERLVTAQDGDLLFGASVSFDHNCGISLSWNLLAPLPKRLQPAARRNPGDDAESHRQACQGHRGCHCCVPSPRELLCSALLNKPGLLMSIWQFHKKCVSLRYQKVFKVVRICFLLKHVQIWFYIHGLQRII